MVHSRRMQMTHRDVRDGRAGRAKTSICIYKINFEVPTTCFRVGIQLEIPR